MLCRWILLHWRVHGKYLSFNSLKFSTKRTAIENVLRTELKGFTNEHTSKLLNKNDFLLLIKPEQLKKSFQRLRKLKFETTDIKIHPSILLQDEYELLNNFQRLQEVGFKEVTAYRLANVRHIMSNCVQFNESFNFLPKNPNIVKNIFMVANIPVGEMNETKYDPEITLKAVHQMALREYFIQRHGYKSSEIDGMLQQHSILKLRSLQSIVKTAKMLENIYNTPVKNLNHCMLTMQPEEIEELLVSGSTLALESNIDVRKVMTLGAKFNLTRIKEVQMICSPFKIPDYVIAFSPKLFYMNYDTLRERLDHLSKLKQAEAFFQHVTIGRVIINMGRIRSQMKSMKMDFNTSFNDTFVDFILNGFLLPRTQAPIFYLSHVLKKTEDEIRNVLQTHPHWNHCAYLIVYKNVEYLLSRGFTLDDIFKDLHIVLYSIDEIKEFFNRLEDPTEMEKLNVDPKKLNKSQILRFCVYLIEKKCDFNGEGVYLNSHAVEFNDDENNWKMEEIIKQINFQ